MTQIGNLPPVEGELASLKARRDALRQAAGLPGAKLRATLDAALAELDAAIDALATRHDADVPHQAASDSQAERRLLRATFTDAPVAMFLLERDGTVRRINKAAGELLQTGTGYATGKPFTTFVSLPSRAAVHTQLATTLRTGNPSQIRCELLSSGGATDCELIAGLVRPRGDAERVIVAACPPGSLPAASPAGHAGSSGHAGGPQRTGRWRRPWPPWPAGWTW